MKFAEKPTQSAEYLRQAIPLMIKYKITPNPLNYALWYTYVSKRAPKLNLELEKALEIYGTCPTLLSDKMFNEHLIKDETNDAAGFESKVVSLVNDLHNKAGVANQRAAQFQTVLDKSLTQLRNQQSKMSNEQIIDTLCASTRSISQSNLDFQAQINAAQDQISRLKAELKKNSNDPRIDPETQLFNRQVFDTEIQQLVQLPAGTIVSLALFEINNFSQFNRIYGQPMSDKIILFIANLLSNQCKSPSMALRYSDTEFAIILLGSDLIKTLAVTESMRSKVKSIRLRQKNSSAINNSLSLSIGVTQMREEDESDSLLNRALKALSLANAAGGNKIIVE